MVILRNELARGLQLLLPVNAEVAVAARVALQWHRRVLVVDG